MGQAKRRGTFEQRAAFAETCKAAILKEVRERPGENKAVIALISRRGLDRTVALLRPYFRSTTLSASVPTAEQQTPKETAGQGTSGNVS